MTITRSKWLKVKYNIVTSPDPAAVHQIGKRSSTQPDAAIEIFWSDSVDFNSNHTEK